jgi:hypothetical protein
MSSRVKQILEARCEGRSGGWVWMSRYKGKHIGKGMVYRQWGHGGCNRSQSTSIGLIRCRLLDACHVPIWATSLLRRGSARFDPVRILFE